MTTETAPKDRGMLFKPEMVAAILDGRKTQTRRICREQPADFWTDAVFEKCDKDDPDDILSWWLRCGPDDPEDQWGLMSQRDAYAAGDRIWVREGLRFADGPPVYPDGTKVKNVPAEFFERDYVRDWLSPIHMPRWASRIVRPIERVRLERIQDISEEDARAEGVPPNHSGDLATFDPEAQGYLCREGLAHIESDPEGDWDGGYFRTGLEAFRSLWDSINGKRGFTWDKNPWVWVYDFEGAGQ
jgi:hypothetical protein